MNSESAVINTRTNKYRDMSKFEIIDEMDRIDGSLNLKLPEKVRSVSAREAAKRTMKVLIRA